MSLLRKLALREDRWLWLTLLLGLLAAASYSVRVFSIPGGIQDDARMFLSWMHRWNEPDLLQGDLVADYWHSVTPWFYKAVFHTAWQIGIEPLLFVKLLPIAIYLLTALFSFRFLRAIGAAPHVAFLTTGLLLLYFISGGESLVNGTPRSFWPPLLLVILDGLARKKIAQTAVAQLFLAGCYPQMTIVTSTVIGLTLIAPRQRWFLDLSGRRLALVTTCAVATIVGILPFVLDAGRFAPTVTLAEALQIPTFSNAGRNRITSPDGTLDMFCGQRLGLFGKKCRKVFDLGFILLSIAVFIGPVLLAVRTLFPAKAGRAASALPLLMLVASLAWFAIAMNLLFRLHLPNRYTAGLLPVGILALAPLIIESISARSSALFARHPKKQVLRRNAMIGFAALLMLGLVAVRPRPAIERPADPQLIAALAALPKESVIAGFVEDLSFSPVLTGRPTLFSRELTIGYQLGYLRPVMKRMEDMRDAILTYDPAVLADRLERNGVDVLLVNPSTLVKPRVPDPFRGFFGPDLEALEIAAARRPTALADLAGECATAKFPTALVLDAACLIRTARTGG